MNHLALDPYPISNCSMFSDGALKPPDGNTNAPDGAVNPPDVDTDISDGAMNPPDSDT